MAWFLLRCLVRRPSVSCSWFEVPRPGEGAAPPFRMPLNCEYGKTCFIQNYVDHDPGPGRADFRCGRLSYDGHHGTDFRLRDEVDMERGVYVAAAAPGVVKAIRDGMADISVRDVSPTRSRDA